MRKAFHVKVGSLVRTLKEFKSYRAELETYNLNELSHDKKKQEFYLESKSALDQVEKKLIDFYQQLKAYIVILSLYRAKTRKLLNPRRRQL